MSSIIGILIGKTIEPWQRIDGAGYNINPEPEFFAGHPVFGGIADEVIDGQSMVRVPAFYFRSGVVADGEHAGKKALWISPDPAPGFTLHPAFRHQGTDLAQFYVGKYQGTPDGDKLGSQPGLKPLTRINFPTMQQAAAERNVGGASGFMLWSIYHLGAIQTLALIELGTPDPKTVLGEGYVRGDGAREVDDSTVAQATYRGITGLWGNVWQMLDGLQTDGEREYRIWKNDGSQVYVPTEVEAPGDGWFYRRSTEQGEGFDLGAAFIPSRTRDSREESAFGNYFWSYTNGVAYHGGTWGSGQHAGLFYLNVTDDAEFSDSNVGGRLAKV